MSMSRTSGLYFQSRIIHGDLVQAQQRLLEKSGPTGEWVQSLKAALTALANLADLEGPLRSLYRDNPSLADQMKNLASSLQFAKYLRNVFVGHINEELIRKAYEWKPELRWLPEERSVAATAFLNLFVLETAINTYVAPDGTHRVFPSETDLMYPPDLERFSAWLSDAVERATRATDTLGTITHGEVEPIGDRSEMIQAFMAAGLTDFARLRKGR